MSEYFSNTEWLLQRLGRFTASEIHKLFTGGRRVMTEEEQKQEKLNGGKRKTIDTLFGDTAETYIRKKLAEILTGEVKEELDTKQAEWGKMHEPEAYMVFEKRTGLYGNYYGVANPKFFPYGESAGCSPDWEIEALMGADFKCPYNSDEHIKNLLLKNEEDFKNKRWEYYCQGQMGMYVRGWKVFHFVSYDPRMIKEQHKMKIIKSYPDVKWRQELELRLEKGTDRLLEMVEEVNSTPSILLAEST